MTDKQDKFWKATKDYKTYREGLYSMAETASQGLKDHGVSASWSKHAAIFGVAMNYRYMLFAFTDLHKAFTAMGQSVDEAYGSLVRQLEQCKELDKTL
jgi:hypothetical protein